MVRTLKKTFCLTQTRIVGEAGDIPISTIEALMKRLPQIIQGYSADNIWNMDKLGLFLKLSRYWFTKENPKSVKVVRNQKSNLLWHFLCPRVDSRYVNLLLLEKVKFQDAFENCLILLNSMVCSIFTGKRYGRQQKSWFRFLPPQTVS